MTRPRPKGIGFAQQVPAIGNRTSWLHVLVGAAIHPEGRNAYAVFWLCPLIRVAEDKVVCPVHIDFPHDGIKKALKSGMNCM